MNDPRNGDKQSTAVRQPDTRILLREFAALGFVMHTHHPATHVPVLNASTDGTHNLREECPDDITPVTIIP